MISRGEQLRFRNEDGPRLWCAAGRMFRCFPAQSTVVFFSVALVAGRPRLRVSSAARRR